MVWVHPPNIASKIFKGVIWNYQDDTNKVYLTFDDGPTPDVTPWILKTLDQFQIKATFFCLGKNVKKLPDLYNEIKENGHAIGSHGYNHLNGWKTKNKLYSDNVNKASEILNTNLYRPPYGKIKPSQIKLLSENYRIVMWNILSRDYDKKMTAKQCYHNVIDHIHPGSIIVFHDSLKAAPNLKGCLERVIDSLRDEYQFGTIS